MCKIANHSANIKLARRLPPLEVY